MSTHVTLPLELNPNIDPSVNEIVILPPSRETPPQYEDVMNCNVPPPSYDSIFSRVREARRTSKRVHEFVVNVFILLISTIGCTLGFINTTVIPLSMIIMGGIYLNDCTVAEGIPIFLLIEGSVSIFEQILSLLLSFSLDLRRKLEPIMKILAFVLYGNFFIGSAWIYHEYQPNYDSSLGKYCDKTFYLFAFWVVTLMYMQMVIIVILVCSLSIGALFYD